MRDKKGLIFTTVYEMLINQLKMLNYTFMYHLIFFHSNMWPAQYFYLLITFLSYHKKQIKQYLIFQNWSNSASGNKIIWQITNGQLGGAIYYNTAYKYIVSNIYKHKSHTDIFISAWS